jgi:hypothetical protein
LTKVPQKWVVEVPGSQSNKRGDQKTNPIMALHFIGFYGMKKHLNNGNNGVKMWVRCVMLG